MKVKKFKRGDVFTMEDGIIVITKVKNEEPPEAFLLGDGGVGIEEVVSVSFNQDVLTLWTKYRDESIEEFSKVEYKYVGNFNFEEFTLPQEFIIKIKALKI